MYRYSYLRATIGSNPRCPPGRDVRGEQRIPESALKEFQKPGRGRPPQKAEAAPGPDGRVVVRKAAKKGGKK